ncbi:MAG: hypothetical protein M1826_002491 [Phylliscum demangeonii]|nr:MAG: hypothetical protein M1826_002491 [Phylliscum demangeonii]
MAGDSMDWSQVLTPARTERATLCHVSCFAPYAEALQLAPAVALALKELQDLMVAQSLPIRARWSRPSELSRRCALRLRLLPLSRSLSLSLSLAPPSPPSPP